MSHENDLKSKESAGFHGGREAREDWDTESPSSFYSSDDFE